MKQIVLVPVVMLFVTTAIGQRHVEFGIKGGVNISNVRDEAFSNEKALVGWHLGALAHIHLNKQFAVQPELMYSAQGAEYPNNDFKLKLNYLNVPILLQYMFNGGFRFQTGPQFGILTDANVKTGDTETDAVGVKTLDISWSFGGGYLSSSGFGVDARYNLGLTNNREDGGELKNRVWQIGVFYQFKH